MVKKEHVPYSWREKPDFDKITIYPTDTARYYYRTVSKSTLLAAWIDRAMRDRINSVFGNIESLVDSDQNEFLE